jgi:hypothetical protein
LVHHLPRARRFWVEHGERSRDGCGEGLGREIVDIDCHFWEEITKRSSTARTIQVSQARHEGGRPGFFPVMKSLHPSVGKI